MFKKLIIVAVLLVVTFSIVGFAAMNKSSVANSIEAKTTESVVALNHEQLKAVVAKRLNVAVLDVDDTPIANIKELQTNQGLFYVSDDGEHLLQGKLYSIGAAGVANLTEQSLSKYRIKGMKEFENDMVIFPAKDEKYQITVFTDISCGYCRKLHKQMDEYNALGITIRYLAFPRGGIGSESFRDLTAVWCAADQKQAMTDAKSGKHINNKSCDSPIAKQYDFGRLAGVNGTPAIMLNSGMMIPGYQEPDQMLEILKSY